MRHAKDGGETSVKKNETKKKGMKEVQTVNKCFVIRHKGMGQVPRCTAILLLPASDTSVRGNGRRLWKVDEHCAYAVGAVLVE